MHRLVPHLLVASICLLPALGFAQEFAAQNAEVDALARLTNAPAIHPAYDVAATEGSETLKSIFFEALPWKSKPTRVFAWLGIPETPAGTRRPAVVLVHGGGGTAFKTWVEKWNAKGYVAISIGVEGQVDRRPAKKIKGVHWESHDWAGPRRQGIYNDRNEPLEEQWMYHAVADTILANSLLRSLPEVDPDKVGLMGISWGGVITSTVMGIDPRFAFAIPVYGCGDLADAPNQYGRSLGTDTLYRQVWDPMLRLPRVEMPTLWFSWTGDSHFPMKHFANCYGAVGGTHMVSLVPKLGHGHAPPWTRPESYAFADTVLNAGAPWLVQTDLKQADGTATLSFASGRSIDKAVLSTTQDLGVSTTRKWNDTEVEFKQADGTVQTSVSIPKGTTAWFINFQSGKLFATSDYQHLK